MSDRWQPLPECYSIELTGTRSLSDTCPTGYTGCLHAMSPWCDRTKCIHCLFKKVHCSSYSRDCYRSSPKWTRTTSHPGAPSKSYAWGKLSFQSYYGNRIPGSDRIQTKQLMSEARHTNTKQYHQERKMRTVIGPTTSSPMIPAKKHDKFATGLRYLTC